MAALLGLAAVLAVQPVAAAEHDAADQSAATPDPSAGSAAPAGTPTSSATEGALEVTVDDDVDGAVPAGGTFAYTIEVTNAGPAAVTDVSLEDELPSALSVTGVQASGPWTCVLASQALEPGEDATPVDDLYCTLEGLAPGASAPPLTVAVQVAEDAGGDLEYTVEATSASSPPARAARTTTVAASDEPATPTEPAALSVDVSDDVEGTVPFGGGSFAYTITVANPGPVEVTQVSLSDQVPADVTVTGVTAPGPWTCVLPSQAGGDLYCTLEALAAGAGAPPLTVAVRVAEDFSGDLANTVVADSAETEPVEATETTTVDVETRVLGTVLEKPDPTPATDVQAAQGEPQLARTGPLDVHRELAAGAAALLVLGLLLVRLGRPVTARR